MAISISNVHSTVGEFQRNYLYKLYIYDVPSELASKFPNAEGFKMNIDLYNTKAIFPNRKTSKIKISWGGEFSYIAGVDESNKEADFEFYEDENSWVWDFFSALKDYTGNEENHAFSAGVKNKVRFVVARVSVDKNKITNARELKGVRIYGVDDGDADKGGSDVNKVKVSIAWDRASTPKYLRGASA